MSRSSRFSPRSLEPAQLERLTVAREPLLKRLEDAVTGAVVSGQARFDLVLGPRGAGKSHLIGVLEGRLRSSAQLAGRTVIVAPPEELHPLSLVQLLAQLLREFPDDSGPGPVADALRSLQRQRDGNQERRAVDLIRARLGQRSLIILLENLDELFDAIGREGQQRLRNILQTERRWSIIATSRSLIPAFTKYEAPFHGTFNQHRIEPLTAEECRDMLAALADAHAKDELAALLRSNKGLARVRGLHHLLGGNPRAMAFLFRQLDEHRLDHFEHALADLADELKPYFQEQMTRVSPAQRAILELLAESWRPLTVTEIAERSFTSQASTSSALRHLRRDALVQALEVGRERYYELGDPLHRLARANERPRDAIAAFARVIRWWYADDSDAEFSVRRSYVLPESSTLGSAAFDELRPPLLEASVREAMDLLTKSPKQAVERARARLQRRESPSMRAALVLALERSGDETGAVEQVFSTVGPLDSDTKGLLLALSLESLSVPPSDPLQLLDAPRTSAIAGAVGAVYRAIVTADGSEARCGLIASFEEASPDIVRLLSDLVTRSMLFERWANADAYDDLGVVLDRLRPTRGAPTLESGLTYAIRRAWHYRRLDALLGRIESLEPLLAVLPKSLRLLLMFAHLCVIASSPEQQATDELAEAWASISRQAPEPELATHEPFLLLAGVAIEVFTIFAMSPSELWSTAVSQLDSDSEKSMWVWLWLGTYHWLASRRPLAPLNQLAARLHDHYGRIYVPVPALTSSQPREAVAQLSEPERAVIRSLLEIHGDREGLAELTLDAKRADARGA